MVCVIAPTKKGNALVVPVITFHAHSDPTCRLEVGDHPFVRHLSCIAYDLAKCLSLVGVEREIEMKTIISKEPTSEPLLTKIQVGLIRSEETPGWVLTEAKNTGLEAYLRSIEAID